MADRIPPDEQANYEIFRECFSDSLLRALAGPVEKAKPGKERRRSKKASKSEKQAPAALASDQAINADDSQTAAVEQLGEFIDYLSRLVFPGLPTDIRSLSHAQYKDSGRLQDVYNTPLSHDTATTLLHSVSPTAIDSLESYGVLPSSSDLFDLRNLLLPVLNSYLAAVSVAPPIWSTTRPDACDLCARDWLPLTYHHLVPKSTHERARKRGWHAEEMLNSVAWLCRACHSFVHRLAGNEQLAREFYTLALIKQGGVHGDEEKRARVEAWVKWIGGVRWKKR